MTFNVALIIPTGIGARIGGFAGDAMTLLTLFAEVCDWVITHPNVANAASFQRLPNNVLYVEGYGLDQIFRGHWALQPCRRYNHVGIIWDSGIPNPMKILHENTIEAVKTTYGVNVVGLQETTAPVSLRLETQNSGRSAGQISNPQVLLESAQQLIEQGANALAVCCLMPNETNEQEETLYQSGHGVDPIAGLEAMISHWLVSQTHLPCAHAPVFPWEVAHPVLDRHLDPRAAAEFITPTFLPCVLQGLAHAPQLITKHPFPANSLDLNHIDAVVVPADALGSIPVLAAYTAGIPILTVGNNTTQMQTSAQALGLTTNIMPCPTYLEVIGHLVALKSKICVPQHIRSHPVPSHL